MGSGSSTSRLAEQAIGDRVDVPCGSDSTIGTVNSTPSGDNRELILETFSKLRDQARSLRAQARVGLSVSTIGLGVLALASLFTPAGWMILGGVSLACLAASVFTLIQYIRNSNRLNQLNEMEKQFISRADFSCQREKLNELWKAPLCILLPLVGCYICSLFERRNSQPMVDYLRSELCDPPGDFPETPGS